MPSGRLVRLIPVGLAAVVGFAVGFTTRGTGAVVETDPERTGVAATPVPDASTTAAMGEGAGKGPGLAAAPAPDAETERTRLAAEVERLTARVAELERERSAGGTGAPRKGPVFTFGEMGTLPAVLEADWQEMAAASKVVADAILEMQRKNDAGEPIPVDLRRRLQENTERVRKYEYRTIDKIPTAAQNNGELTHPISFTNIVAAMLEQAGKALTPAQIRDLDRLGSAFDVEFQKVRANWTDSVARARRMLEEFRLKRRFSSDAWAVLSPEQRAVLVDPAFHAVAGVDLFDPTLMVIHTTVLVARESVDEMKKGLATALRPRAGLAEGAVAPRLDAAVDAFLAKTTRALQPVPKSQMRRYTSDEALVAGEATADLVDSLLTDSEATPAAKKALFNDPTWYIPRLLAK